MKILDNALTINGCYYVRNQQPNNELRKLGHEIQYGFTGMHIDPRHYDLYMFSRGYDGDISKVIRAMKEFNRPVVYDIDDAMDLIEEKNINYQDVLKALPSYYMMLRTADAVTTTTPELSDHLKKFTSAKIHVFPNTVKASDWKLRRGREEGEKIRIGFAGSNTHIEDILVLMDALIRLKREGLEFTFVVFGFVAGNISVKEWVEKNSHLPAHNDFNKALKRFADKYEELESCSEFHSMVPVELYPWKLADLNIDIGCCPLLDTEFNRMKSPIKFYEYAMCGTMTLASNVLPYNKEMKSIHTVGKTADDWVKALKGYWRPELQKIAWESQSHWVLKNRQVETYTKYRENLYLELIKKSDEKETR